MHCRFLILCKLVYYIITGGVNKVGMAVPQLKHTPYQLLFNCLDLTVIMCVVSMTSLGRTEIMQTLLDAGLDPNCVDTDTREID